MGVIKKILFRGNVLGKPQHRNLFLDMEENIHIHYRDLRIELSRGEFEDIVGIFTKQSDELLKIIAEKKYQDGKLPNANQDDVRIWTESRLRHELKYHPQRLSLEECGDGYHFHYRNYKLLIEKEEFRQIQRLFATLDLDSPYAATYDEVLQLLHANEIDFSFDAGNMPGTTLAIVAAQYHLAKIRDIFNYINFRAEDAGFGVKCYTNDQLQVRVRAEKQRSTLDYRYLRGLNSVSRLADYLSAHGATIDPLEINLIKCQVLDLYYAVKAGANLGNIDLEPQSWLYSAANRQVIFPYKGTSKSSAKVDAENLYRAWSTLVNGCRLVFIKPGKDILSTNVQAMLKQQIAETLKKEVAAYAAVDKIYLMGSAVRSEMGQYQVPFIHGKLAKLGSDIDILVEILPQREADVPGFWDLHLPMSSNHCAVFHIAQIPIVDDTGGWQQQFPNIKFLQHLVDAYVYLPSTGYRQEINAFLKKFNAQLFYDRTRDGILYQSEIEQHIATRLTELYGYREIEVEKMKVQTS